MTGFLAYSMPLKDASADIMRVMCCTECFFIFWTMTARPKFETEAAVAKNDGGLVGRAQARRAGGRV